MNSKPGEDTDWQRLWFVTRQRDWSSLAIVPSDPGIDVGPVAEALVATGRIHGERPVGLLRATGAQLADVHRLTESLSAMTARGEWVIVPVDSVSDNPTAVPIVQATSAALLVVRLGESLLPSAHAAINAIGREHFLGSFVIGQGTPKDFQSIPAKS